jgi:hypothetical protein
MREDFIYSCVRSNAEWPTLQDARRLADSPRWRIDATNRKLVNQIRVHKFGKTTYPMLGRQETLGLLIQLFGISDRSWLWMSCSSSIYV